MSIEVLAEVNQLEIPELLLQREQERARRNVEYVHVLLQTESEEHARKDRPQDLSCSEKRTMYTTPSPAHLPRFLISPFFVVSSSWNSKWFTIRFLWQLRLSNLRSSSVSSYSHAYSTLLWMLAAYLMPFEKGCHLKLILLLYVCDSFQLDLVSSTRFTSPLLFPFTK